MDLPFFDRRDRPGGKTAAFLPESRRFGQRRHHRTLLDRHRNGVQTAVYLKIGRDAQGHVVVAQRVLGKTLVQRLPLGIGVEIGLQRARRLPGIGGERLQDEAGFFLARKPGKSFDRSVHRGNGCSGQRYGFWIGFGQGPQGSSGFLRAFNRVIYRG